jgi:amino acid adenylation domain-containing protein
VAVSDGGRTLTYAELDRQSNRLAHRLAKLGAGPETLVGLCMPRSADLIVALVAILKAGSGYLPLDPQYPPDRLRAVAADAGCCLVVGEEVTGAAVVRPDDESLMGEPDSPLISPATPGNVAYVIYTSGSTGQPKGVVVTHANAERLFSVTQPELGFCEQDVWTLFHSVSFDFSVWEIWGALLAGGRLVIVPYVVSRDSEAFLRLLVAERVTVLSQTPTAFRQLLRAVEAAGFPPTSLRLVVFGGEKLDPPMLRSWAERYGDESPRLVNMYGITETTVHVTFCQLGAHDLTRTDSLIGRPLADLRVHLLDERLKPVAPGQIGEMFIAGAGVSRGYLNRPDLTAERFLRDPFGPDESVMYRSGDLAEIDANGQLIFRGRADRQIQLRGFRIEPGEIEATLRAHPGVSDAVVVMGPADQRLAAYWIPERDCVPGPAVAELRAWMAARLPDYMVPASFAVVDEFPMTAQGKLDETMLPGRATPQSEGAGTQPRGEIEERLAGIWAELLEMDSVDIDEDFFAVGGDSILATELVAEARASGIMISVAMLFQHPTIAGLARAGEYP